MSKLHDYYWALPIGKREHYATRVGTSVDYLRVHLVPHNALPGRIPRKPLMMALAKGTAGKVAYDDVLDHFYAPRRRSN